MDNIRNAEQEDITLLDEYALLTTEIKILTAKKEEIKSRVAEILINELEPGDVQTSRYKLSFAYIKQYSPKRWEEEFDVTVNGQTIIASINHLKEATSALDKYTKRDHWEIASRYSITIKDKG